jgi:ankyrin repeat protein
MLFVLQPLMAAPGALADASMRGDVASMKSLLKTGADPNEAGQFGTPALHWRIDRDDLPGARLLLDAGANPNGKTAQGISPLNLAIANGNEPMVSLLLQAGADSNQLEQTGESHLMMAAQAGSLPVVKALLAHGAKVDFREAGFGQTALMYAARAGHADIVAELLAKGAQPNVATNIGQTPRFIGPNSVPGFGFGVGIIRGGVPADRGRREPTPGGMTPLHYAARHNQVKVIEVLLKAGATVDAREANDITPLLMAVSNNNMAAAHYLLTHGATVNVQDWYGRSPLWEAVNVRNLYVHTPACSRPHQGVAGSRCGRECENKGNAAIPQLPAGNHRLAGVGGLHGPDPFSHRGAGG